MKLIAAMLLVAAAAPAPEIRYFRLQRPINLSQNAAGQACVVLDTQIFSHAASGVSDLRLYRGADETPYVIHSGWPNQPSQPAIAPLNRGVRAGKTVFDAAMPDAEYRDVQLNLVGQNFLAAVTVTGSQSMSSPPTRIGTYTLFDFSSQHLGRSTILHLPRSNFRFLHFEISGPIKPDQLVNLVAAAAPPIEPKYLTILSAGQFARDSKKSVARFNLPPNVPVDRIVFSPIALPVNFSRAVEVQATEIKAEGDSAAVEPSTVASGNLLRIHRVQDNRHIDEEQLVLATPISGFPFPTLWTITIENGDDVPVVFSNVQVQMRERNLCFEVASGAAYVLYYGDNALTAPRYDYAAWFALQPSAAVATLGAENANPAFQERPDQRAFTEKHPVLLWIVLVVVVLLLGLVALRTAQQTQRPAP